jgi:nuclease S1
VFVTRRTALLIVLICVSAPLFAWGPEGHKIVADIARSHLTEITKQHIRELLGNDDLAAVSTWADEIRPQRPESFGWHFVDIPKDSTGFSQPRDCYKPDEKHPYSVRDHHNCVVDRIEMFARTLAEKSASHDERVEALKFLVHFVADVHQPLHAVAEARGGNDIHISEFGSPQCGDRPCNLHFAWDVGLIEHSGRPEHAYVSYLEGLIASRELFEREAGTPQDWANESWRVAKNVWLNEGGSINEAYYKRYIQVLDERLALSGVRLAYLLNSALGR